MVYVKYEGGSFQFRCFYAKRKSRLYGNAISEGSGFRRRFKGSGEQREIFRSIARTFYVGSFCPRRSLAAPRSVSLVGRQPRKKRGFVGGKRKVTPTGSRRHRCGVEEYSFIRVLFYVRLERCILRDTRVPLETVPNTSRGMIFAGTSIYVATTVPIYTILFHQTDSMLNNLDTVFNNR